MPRIYIQDLLIPQHEKVLLDALDHKYVHYTLLGGRGGLKSSAIAFIIILLLTRPENRNVHAVVFRKVANTMRDSVFAQINFAISTLGLEEYFKASVSPMEITYRPTGQKILFRGVDKKEKIKSIKVPFGYLGITWFEELDQYCGREEIRNVLQSTMRGAGGRFWNFESFNPPITRANWANKDILIERPNRCIIKTSYLDAPVEWLSQTFLDEAEALKEADFRAYQHEYLGEPVGTGGNVFEWLEVRTLTDDFIAKFDRIYQGIDWGWFPDPFAFIRLYYDHARATVYLLDELYVNKWSNEDTARWIKKHKYQNVLTTCDSQEKKSIFDMRRLGVNANSAQKGPGSVDYGMKWLQRRKIVVDPNRTPHAYKELSEYEYEQDKEGNFISGYPDENNHIIDAMRYALEGLMRGSKTIA